jgi:heterodisulfide reductase subunit C
MGVSQPSARITLIASLRTIVLAQTGQDVNRCCSCALCDEITESDGAVNLSMLMQWILANDERALTNPTVWSDEVLRQADHACTNQVDIPAVLLALRGEASRRGIR